MNNPLEKLFKAADNHGEDSGEPDHTVGDLQGLLRRSWALMSFTQKLQLLASPEVKDLVEAGSQGEFDHEKLVSEMTAPLGMQEAAIQAAGYAIQENFVGYFWVTKGKPAGPYFLSREDAVSDAYQHLMQET